MHHLCPEKSLTYCRNHDAFFPNEITFLWKTCAVAVCSPQRLSWDAAGRLRFLGWSPALILQGEVLHCRDWTTRVRWRKDERWNWGQLRWVAGWQPQPKASPQPQQGNLISSSDKLCVSLGLEESSFLIFKWCATSHYLLSGMKTTDKHGRFFPCRFCVFFVCGWNGPSGFLPTSDDVMILLFCNKMFPLANKPL